MARKWTPGERIQTLEPAGYQRIPSSGSGIAAAVNLTPPDIALIAVIQAESVSVRWRDDPGGAAPTAIVGSLIPANESLLYPGDLTAIRFIEAAAGAVLNVTYYS